MCTQPVCRQVETRHSSSMIPSARPLCAVILILLVGAPGTGGFAATPATRWASPTAAWRAGGMPTMRCGRDRWALKSSETESRGTGGDGSGSVGSDEENNWGMDENIDVNAIRAKMMGNAGYSKRGGSDEGDEWITIDEDGSDGNVDQLKEALASSLGGDMLNNDALKGADASMLVEELLEDTDFAKFFDEEFEKGTSALKALADELKSEQDTKSYADTMAQELADIFRAEEEKAAKEIETRQAPVKAKLDKATVELEEAMVDAENARRAFEGDILLQLLSFRKKGVLRQAAFVGAVLIANQAVYQAILVADDRGGSPAFALGGLLASVVLVWVYGYRPISFK